MQVTIIGAGNMGRGIGSRLVAGGHDVKIIDNDSEQATQLADELAGAGDGSAEGAAPSDPLSRRRCTRTTRPVPSELPLEADEDSCSTH